MPTPTSGTSAALENLARIVRATYMILARQMRDRPARIDALVQRQWDETADHLSQVREGFVLTLRVGPATFPSISVNSRAELNALVQHILIDWTWMEELGLSWAAGTELETLGNQVISYAHARIALGVVPRLPREAITFPQAGQSYADVPVPRSAGELLSRIEELEGIIYKANVKAVQELPRSSLRRTYAFFEASNWLVEHYLPNLFS